MLATAFVRSYCMRHDVVYDALGLHAYRSLLSMHMRAWQNMLDAAELVRSHHIRANKCCVCVFG